MSAVMNPGLSLTARDVTGQRTFSIKNFSPELTISELIHSQVPKMGFDTNDANAAPKVCGLFSNGRPDTYMVVKSSGRACVKRTKSPCSLISRRGRGKNPYASR